MNRLTLFGNAGRIRTVVDGPGSSHARRNWDNTSSAQALVTSRMRRAHGAVASFLRSLRALRD